MNAVMAETWCMALLPVAMGIGLRNPATYETTVSFGTSPINFRDQNIQVPFYNNVLGYSLDVAGSSLVLTSGLFQTAWRCNGIDDKSGSITVSLTASNSDCSIYESIDVGNYYAGSETNPKASPTTQDNGGILAFNLNIKGTFASWAYKADEFGFGWGRSVSYDSTSGKVAVGCPGCTGKSESISTAANSRGPSPDKKLLSGLVFEWVAAGTAPVVKDPSTVVTNKRSYGDFDFARVTNDFNSNFLNWDDNGYNPQAGLSFGTAVKYIDNKLIATRSRSSRVLARAQGYRQLDADRNDCDARFGVPVSNEPFCQLKDGVYFAIGDAIDATNLVEPSSFAGETDPNGINRAYTLKGWGYQTPKIEGGDVFNVIPTAPPETPQNARFGQSVTHGKFFGEKDAVFGAPGYGSFGAVFVYNAKTGDKTQTENGLRYNTREPDAEISGPKNVVKSNFGYALRAVETNGDFDLLAVGAPTYSKDKYRGGAAFVYQKKDAGFQLKNQLRPKGDQVSVSARFGSSISSIDLDGNGEHDIIVGAPFNQIGCDKFTGRSYCGALFVFASADLKGNREIVEPSQVVFGKDVYGMLGSSVVATSTKVYASSPGVFGRNGIFAESLLKGVDSRQLYWPVQPKVVAFGQLQLITVTTEVVGVTVLDASDNVVSEDATKVVGDDLTINIEKFKLQGESFTVTFRAVSTTTGREFFVDIPDLLLNDPFTTTTTLTAGSNPPVDCDSVGCVINGEAEIKVNVKLSQDLDSDQLARLADFLTFKLEQIIDGTKQSARAGSSVTASTSLNIDSTTQSFADIALTVDSDFVTGTGFKINQQVETSTTITNSRGSDDSSLSLRVEIYSVLSTNFLDFTTPTTVNGQQRATWSFTSLVSEIDETEGLPISQLSQRLGPLASGESLTVPLNFRVSEIFDVSKLKMKVTVFGNDLEKSDETPLKLDDNCDPQFVTEVGLQQVSIVQGGLLDIETRVDAAPGTQYRPRFTIDIGPYMTIDTAAQGCIQQIYAVEYCNGTDIVSITEIDVGAVVQESCYELEAVRLICEDTDFLTFKFNENNEPTVFKNILRVRSNLIPAGTLVELPYDVQTKYSGSECRPQAVFVNNIIIAASNVKYDGGSESVAWWIIVVSVAGALLLAALIVLILWKAGFFKRTKPPTDGTDGSNGLDEELQAGSMLRG